MSNPLWCSHVCWSRARVAWDYYGSTRTRTRTCTRTHTEPIYTLSNVSLHYVGYHRNVPGDVHDDCRGLDGTRGRCLYGTRSGETFLPHSYWVLSREYDLVRILAFLFSQSCCEDWQLEEKK